ncbi:unnamed protein product [Heterosigma akashiwo]
MLSIAANKGYAVEALDISTAFLNGDINRDMCVKQPPGFVDKDHLNKSCCYVRRNPSTGEETMVAVYVDDLVISSSHASVVTDLKASFGSRFKIPDLGPLNQILGIKVTRDLRNKCFFLSQASFIKDAITKFGLDFLPAVCAPMDHTADLVPTPGYTCSLPDSNRYCSMVGALEWLANCTRPELAFAMHKLQRFQSNPEPKHFEAAQRVFRYLKGT